TCGAQLAITRPATRKLRRVERRAGNPLATSTSLIHADFHDFYAGRADALQLTCRSTLLDDHSTQAFRSRGSCGRRRRTPPVDDLAHYLSNRGRSRPYT